ncbi:uncharacterized protein LOC144168898 [Haemaphysalis longicornis]
MSDKVRKRRKQYLDAENYFQVPASTFYKRAKENAAALQTAAASVSEMGHQHPSTDTTASSTVPEVGADSEHDGVPPNDPENNYIVVGADSGRDEVPPDCEDDYVSEHSCESSDEDETIGDFEGDFADEYDLLGAGFAKFDGQTLPNSQVTKTGAIAAVMAFAISHGLSWAALGDLTKLINFLFGANALPPSMYLFRKLWSDETQDVVQYHYVCEQCSAEMNVDLDEAHCSVCNHSETVKMLRDRGSFFVMLNLEKQVRFLIEKTKAELHKNLEKLHQPASNITDITSSECYARLKEERSLTRDDLTLTVNTDGSPVWKSSKTSVWPVQFIVNELPPHLRFKNCVLAGLWFGKTHPNMQLFLSKFVAEVNSIRPLKWEYMSHTHVTRTVVLSCSVDAPARAAVLNMVPFNGYFGCPWCLIHGEHIAGSMRYTMTEPPEARTSATVATNMELAVVFKDTVNGIKGPSALMNLRGLDLVNGFSVEYMHCALLGVTRQLTETFLSSSNSGLNFYIGDPSTLEKIDARLLAIKPPHCVTRLPRSLKERSHWKASEWRQWILFYAVPCLRGILSIFYWRHLAKFTEALHTLLQEQLSYSEIDRAEQLLESFVSRCQALYGISFLTFNVHALLHLAHSVRSLGPLWAHSAFVFEGGNGAIVRQVSAAKGLPHQITERVVMFQQLHQLINSPRLPLGEKLFAQEFLGYSHVKNALRVNDGLCLLGVGKPTTLSREEQRAVHERCGATVTRALQYECFVQARQVFHSAAYKRPTKSDTTFVRTCDKEYKRIEKILCLERSQIVLLCRAVVLADVHSFVPHIKECFLSHDTCLEVLLPTEIADTCLFVDFPEVEKTFICDLSNKIERD